MSARIRELVSKNLRKPEGLFGSLVSRFVFDKRNVFLERNAARLCKIQPHHKVLEIGFGPGHGLKAAYSYVKDGTGVIYGVDASELMLRKAHRNLSTEIQKKKIDLILGTAEQLPYNTDMFDSVFHCNTFIFWPNMKMCVQELYRVMKPGSSMVTTMNLSSLRESKEKGFMKYGNLDPVTFMWELENCGFEDVKFEYMSDGDKKFEAIFARINEKPAYDEDFEEEIAAVSDMQSDHTKPPDLIKLSPPFHPSLC